MNGPSHDISFSDLVRYWIDFNDVNDLVVRHFFLSDFERPELKQSLIDDIDTEDANRVLNEFIEKQAQRFKNHAEGILEDFKTAIIQETRTYVETHLIWPKVIFSTKEKLYKLSSVFSDYSSGLNFRRVDELASMQSHYKSELNQLLDYYHDYRSRLFKTRKKEADLAEEILSLVVRIVQNNEELAVADYKTELYVFARDHINVLLIEVSNFLDENLKNDGLLEEHIFQLPDSASNFVSVNGYIPSFTKSAIQSHNVGDLANNMSVKKIGTKVSIEIELKIPNDYFNRQEFIYEKEYSSEQVIPIDETVNLGLFPRCIYKFENQSKPTLRKVFSNLSGISFYNGAQLIAAKLDEVDGSDSSINIYTIEDEFNIIEIPYRDLNLKLIIRTDNLNFNISAYIGKQCLLYNNKIAIDDIRDDLFSTSLVDDKAFQSIISELSASIGKGNEFIYQWCIAKYRSLQKFVPFYLRNKKFEKTFEIILNNFIWFIRYYTLSEEGYDLKKIVYISDNCDGSFENKLKQLSKNALRTNNFSDDAEFDVAASSTLALSFILGRIADVSTAIFINLSLNNSQVAYLDYSQAFISKSLSLNQILCDRLLFGQPSLFCRKIAQNLLTYFIQKEETDTFNEFVEYDKHADLSILLSDVFHRDDINLILENNVVDENIVKNTVILFFSLLYSIVQFCIKLKKDIPTRFFLSGNFVKLFILIGDETRLSKLSKVFLEVFPGVVDPPTISFQYLEVYSMSNLDYVIDGFVTASRVFEKKAINDVVYYGFENEPTDKRIPITELDNVKEKVLANHTNFLDILRNTKLSKILKNMYNIDASDFLEAQNTADSSFLLAYRSWSKVDTEFPKEPLFFWPQERFLSSMSWSDEATHTQDLEMHKKYDVFISYRRTDKQGNKSGSYIARNVYQELKSQLKRHKHLSSFEIFFDYSECTDGYFEKVILEAAKNCKFFIIIMTKDVFSRCDQEKDWVRREIETALSSENCKIIPVNPDNDFNKESLDNSCPTHIRDIVNLQFSDIQMGTLFEKSIELLIETRFNRKKQ